MIPDMLLFGAILLTGAVATSAAPVAGADLYRLELQGGGSVWSQDPPTQTGTLLLFHRYPDGVLVSIRRSDLVRIALAKRGPTGVRGLAAGAVVDLGPTGGGAASSAAREAGAGAKRAHSPALGETKDGKALFNPDRAYRSDWDSKQVPGLNLGYPASPNDYREGRTLAYPSASSVQTAPGDLPRARVETGEPPKGPH